MINNKAPTENYWFKNKHPQNLQQTTEAASNPLKNNNHQKANNNSRISNYTDSLLQNQPNIERRLQYPYFNIHL